MIGDPGGKQDERQLLDLQTIEGYLEGIRPQLGQFLDLDRALLLNNADWLSTLSTLEYLRDVGKHFTVNQMVAKESVKTRFERPDQGISYTEFSYMLLQAYDFLRLHLDHGCDVQFGGSDQWGNITMGVDFVRKVCGDEVWGFTTPLIVKSDGTKYGKTESGTVWLDPQADQPLRHVPVLPQHARRAGGRAAPVPYLPRARGDRRARPPDGGAAATPRGPAGARPRRHRAGPRRRRGGQVRGGVGRPLRRGDRRAQRGDAAGRHRGRARRRPSPGRSCSHGLTLVDTLERTGLAKSKKEARRTVEQGGAYVNNVRQTDDGRTFAADDLLHDRYLVLRKGRKEVHIVQAT